MDSLQKSNASLAEDVFILPIVERSSIRYIDGLILERASQVKGAYRRMGHFHFDKTNHWMDFMGTIKALKLLEVEANDCHEVRSEQGQRQIHIIQLI